MGADHFDEQPTTDAPLWQSAAVCWLVGLAACFIGLAIGGN